MIQIHNDYLDENVFDWLQDYCYANKFEIVKVGEKEFSVLQIPSEILSYFQIPGHEIILSFIRDAYSDFDTDCRIHADSSIAGQKTSLASVLYINKPEGVTPNGTAFWEHEKHGLEFPEEAAAEEFDRLLTEEANDLSKWTQNAYVGAIPNRLVTYNSQLFHSKSPAKIETGRRIIAVFFYKQITNP